MTNGGQFWVDRVWYGDSPAWIALLPMSWLFGLAVWLRRRLYRIGLLKSVAVGAPVVVVGNLSTGGTGKTPVTIAIVEALRARGFEPGVVSRGYRGRVGAQPVRVTPQSEPSIVGDEPVLIATRCGCPVVVHPDRVRAARQLVEEGVDVVIADDGLQHYRLARDVEVAVIDGRRWFGNGRLLPCGPLREPRSRLQSVDRVLINGEPDGGLRSGIDGTVFSLVAREARQLDDAERRDLAEFEGKRVHAVAAIGHPERFFAMLRELGADVSPHPLPDHAALSEDDLDFGDTLDVVMTEKDAVKCRGLAAAGRWYVPVELTSGDDRWLDDIASRIGGVRPSKQGTEEDIDHG